MKDQSTCSHCGQPLGAARLIVHDPNGVSGEFHTDQCFFDAVSACRKDQNGVDAQAQRLHDDADVVLGRET